MTKPGPSVTSGADTQPGSDSLFPSGFGGGAAIRTGGVGTAEIADSSVAAADLNLPSVAAALAARTEFTGIFARTIGTSNGTDDTTTINALLTAANTAGGGTIRGLPGQNYKISAALKVGSYTTLDMTGCTVTGLAGLADNMVTNLSRSLSRTVMDGVTTATSTTVTSATANFASADIGATCWVWAANTNSGILRSTISSVTNSTTAVLADAAVLSVTGAQISIGPRDAYFSVVGGTWVRGSTGGANTLGHGISFRRADSWSVRNLTWLQDTQRGYAINGGDVTDFTVETVRFNAKSDGVHINGPASSGTIRDLTGYTRDDTVSITPNDWPSMNDVYGDITDILVSDIKPYLSDNCVVKVLGGSASPLTTASRIRVRNVSGYSSATAQAVGGVVQVGDDTSFSQTTGGLVDDVTVENVSGACKTGLGLVYVTGSNINTLRVKGVSLNNPNLTVNGLVYVITGAVVQSLEVFDAHIQNCASGSRNDIVSIDSATVVNLVISDAYAKWTNAGYVARLALSTGTSVSRLLLHNIVAIGPGSSGGLINSAFSANTLSTVKVQNAYLSGLAWLADINGTVDFDLLNVETAGSTAGIMNVRSAAVLRVRGADTKLTQGTNGWNVAAGGKVAIVGTDMLATATAGGVPTIAAGAGAGTSPTVAITGTDRTGNVTVTLGTTPGSGAQATVTFIGTWPATPKVTLTPTNANAAAAQLYVSAVSTTAFTVSSGATPGGNLTFTYLVS